MEQDAGEANASAVAPSAAADADSSAGDGAGHAGLDTSFIRKVLRDEERAAERARPFVPPRIGMKLGGRD
ncbi:MAG TPA: hypothetical protein VK447_21320, partial [Myxococcaceae bacterium]|nr:hypothetical protein [Myxococcaceae bacterium]